MAVAVRSVATVAWATRSPSGSDITQPVAGSTGLTVGDLMLVDICNEFAGLDWSSPAWTRFMNSQNAGGTVSQWFWKTATSGDVSSPAWTFTETTGGAGSVVGSGFMAVTGADPTNPILTSNAATASFTANPSFACAITPSITNCLIVMQANCDFRSAGVSGYAVVNNNPTWTEQWDFGTTLSDDYSMSMATGIYAATSSTGNASITATTGQHWVGQLFVIQPPVPVVSNTNFFNFLPL